MFQVLTYKNLAKFKLYPIILLALILCLAIFFSTKLELIGKANSAEPDPAIMGQWSEVYEWPVKAVHTSLLPNGSVITWPSKEGDNPYIWDPATNTISPAAQAGINIFCAGHTLLGDGKLFVAGGHVVNPVGLPTAIIYDSTINAWKRIPDMNAGRWYPTTTVLANGDVLTISGSIDSTKKNNLPQVWDIRTSAWRDLTGAIKDLSLYPWMFQAPNGKVFNAGSYQATGYLDTSGTGAWGQTFRANFGKRNAGTSVMYGAGKIIIIGGAISGTAKPTRTAEIINLNDPSPKWTYTGSMTFPRRHVNSTLLPTGQVLVTGGTKEADDNKNFPAFAAEVWTPSTGLWTTLAKNKIYRGYHSTALLLPDGRVLVAGGEWSGTSAEIFSPPYLFKGPRPEITTAPTNVNYGEKFTITTPNMNEINKVRIIRLGSVTHSFNQSQVINEVAFTKTVVGLELTASNSKTKTPPGYYMLFILDANNIPSVAKIIKIGDINIDLSQIPTPSTVFTATTPDPAIPEHDHTSIFNNDNN